MRVDGWQLAFWQEIEAAQTRDFKWGTHDCVTFAMHCVYAITQDRDLIARVRRVFGEWSDANTATRAHKGELDRAVRQILGEPVKWTQLRMGDVALWIDEHDREAIAVHDGVQFVAASVDRGLRSISFKRIRHGWRIE